MAPRLKRLVDIARKLGSALTRTLLQVIWRNDPWARFAASLEPGAFGAAETTPRAALSFRSSVQVDSLNDICAWLIQCEPAAVTGTGFEAGTTADFAAALELERRGNCKSLASWSFAKLNALRYQPTLVVGRWDQSADPGEFHTWVLFEDNGITYLLESVEKHRARMIRPLVDVRHHYVPLYSGSASGATHLYLEYLRRSLRNSSD